MTVLSSETSVLSTGARLPRVNLLPPEIAEGQKLRKVQLGLGAVVAVAICGVAGMYVQASHSVSSAETALTTAQTRAADLDGQIRRFDGITKVMNDAAAAKAQVALAMSDEVRYSWLLKDLSLSIPGNVWVKSLTVGPKTAAPGTGPAAAATTTPAVATLTVTGYGLVHDDVALWLESLAGQRNAKGQKTYDNTYFSNSTEAVVNDHPVVTFTSSADITMTALSRRYLTAGS